MVDMLATVFEAVAMSVDTAADELLIVKTDFTNAESDLSMLFWVLPDPAILAAQAV